MKQILIEFQIENPIKSETVGPVTSHLASLNHSLNSQPANKGNEQKKTKQKSRAKAKVT